MFRQCTTSVFIVKCGVRNPLSALAHPQAAGYEKNKIQTKSRGKTLVWQGEFQIWIFMDRYCRWCTGCSLPCPESTHSSWPHPVCTPHLLFSHSAPRSGGGGKRWKMLIDLWKDRV